MGGTIGSPCWLRTTRFLETLGCAPFDLVMSTEVVAGEAVDRWTGSSGVAADVQSAPIAGETEPFRPGSMACSRRLPDSFFPGIVITL